MSLPTYILCPGQGAQAVGMGKDFAEKFPTAHALYHQASAILGFDLAEVCFGGPEDRLNQTDVAQPAIFVTSIACFRAAESIGKIDAAAITAFAGLSLGEYSALHLAGVFTFEDGVKLVAARGKNMQEAATATPSGMVSLMGADEAAAVKLCEENAHGEVLVPANFNAPGQIVVSGTLAACQRIAAAADAAGFKAIPLKVAGAFHSPIMQRGADAMAAELERVQFNVPAKPVYSNVTATPHRDVSSMKRLLVDQIVKPVRWEQTMQTLVKQADACWIEVAPGRVLTGLLKKINRRLPVETLSTVEALAAG